MKIYFSPASPFVRKVMACACELGLKIEKLPSAAHPINRDATIVALNPLGKVPTFITESGDVLYDSRVACEYLDSRSASSKMFPTEGDERWKALVNQALADGLLDAALLARYEKIVRPADKFWEAWFENQMEKIDSALDRMAETISAETVTVDIGTISVACSLGYLDFRFPNLDWRQARPGLAEWFAQFSERESMRSTRPSD